MSEKFELIMEAIKTSLSGVSATIERNVDVPQSLEGENLVILRDGQEQASERPLGGFTNVTHDHMVEIVVIVAPADPDDRDSDFADLCGEVRDSLLFDPSFGGLVGGLDFDKPTGVTEASAGASGIKAGTIEVNFTYDTNSFF